MVPYGGRPYPFPPDEPASRHDGASLRALVRERRVSAGLTQRELATAAGVSVGALRDLEQGRTRCPRWAAVAAITAALGTERPAGTRVRIGALGPLTALRDGCAVRLGPSRQRAVLGLLALHWPSGVSRDVIVDMLWGERPPRSAAAEVHGYVSRLRRLLDPERAPRGHDGPVMLADTGYRLGDGMGLDLAEFRQLSRRADEAGARGEFSRACALYERSLGLWRGEVLADVELLQDHPAAAEAACCRCEVVLRFAHAAAAAGVHERALPHLRALCASEPFHERAHASLMTALAATGQQAAALQVFAELSRRLGSELGVRPGPEVASAQTRILRQGSS
jgi:DNA-binding SARP family transcriptional activator/DNA-binding XRE family transcriptional regulator